MRWLYKYPQARLSRTPTSSRRTARRSRAEPEYELLDTGVFDEDRYFDVFVEYAKASPEDLLVRDHGDEPRAGGRAAPRRCRRCGSATPGALAGRRRSRSCASRRAGRTRGVIAASHAELGDAVALRRGRRAAALHRERDEPRAPLRHRRTATPYVKDAFHDCVVDGRHEAVNPAERDEGGRASPRSIVGPARPPAFGCGSRTVARGGRDPIRSPSSTRCRRPPARGGRRSIAAHHAGVGRRGRGARHASGARRDALEQAVLLLRRRRWLAEHGVDPLAVDTGGVRNADWDHMENADVISMPDKWEYPWYAAWDLAFHAVALSRWSTPTSPRSSSS